MKQSSEYRELLKLLEFINKNYENSTEAFVYHWHHSELNLDYIGSHTGSTDDGYTGSGTDFQNQLKRNPIEEWERTILSYCSEKDKCEIEELFLKYFDAANNPHFLNKTNATDGWGKGKDHYRFDTGLFVGEPHSSAGSEKRRKWWRTLPQAHRQAIKEHQKKQREGYKRRDELIETITRWGLDEEDLSKLSTQYQNDDLKKMKLEQLEELYQDIQEKIRPALLKFIEEVPNEHEVPDNVKDLYYKFSDGVYGLEGLNHDDDPILKKLEQKAKSITEELMNYLDKKYNKKWD